MGINEFFSMGGYGFYIWWSFGMAAVLMSAEWFFIDAQRKTAIQRLKRIARLNETQEKI